MEKQPNKLVFIRHGENIDDDSVLNSDLRLSKNGIRQAEWATKILGRDIDRIDITFTSTSKRTIETAEIINQGNGNYIADGRLLERGWNSKKTHEKETDEDAQYRLREFLDEIYNNHNGENVLIVTHGGLIKLAEKIIENKSPDSELYNIDNCSIIRYSRIDDETGYDAEYFRWKKTINPFGTHENQKIIPSGTNVLFVRHGESKSNLDGVLAGGMDFPLTETGISQAHKVSDDLYDLGIKFDKIFTSPLSRAYDTAKIIAQQCGIDEDHIVILNDLTGCGGGDLEGRPYSDWYSTPIDELVSKHGAESYINQRSRIGSAILKIIRNTDHSNKSIIVSHSSVFQVFQALNNNIKDESETFKQNKLKPGEYFEVNL